MIGDVVVHIIFVELVELGELPKGISHEWNSSLTGLLAEAGDINGTHMAESFPSKTPMMGESFHNVVWRGTVQVYF